MQVKAKGQVGGVASRASKTSGRVYRTFQLIQKTHKGAFFIVSGRCFDDALKLEPGATVELDGVASTFKFKDGSVGLSFDIFGK